jgi:hypothetical protein
MGNSSSSGVVGIGIGAEMVPRIDLCRVLALARPAVEPDLPKILGMAVGEGWKPGINNGGIMEREEQDGCGWAKVVDKAVVYS